MAAASAAAILGTSLIQSSPAFAHASPISRYPADGAVMSTAPTWARIVFSDPVTGASNGVSVIDASGRRYSGASEYWGSTVTVPLRGLTRGRYALMYRVTSDDGHVISRASGFSVGLPDPSAVPTTMSLGGQTVRITGTRVGKRTIGLPWPKAIGEVSWRLPGVAESFTWAVVNGQAQGMLPFAGVYRVIIKVYTSATAVQTLRGRVRIR